MSPQGGGSQQGLTGVRLCIMMSRRSFPRIPTTNTHTDTWRHPMPAYTTRHPTDAPPDNTPSESTALETRDHPHTAAALVRSYL